MPTALPTGNEGNPVFEHKSKYKNSCRNMIDIRLFDFNYKAGLNYERKLFQNSSISYKN